MRSLARIVCALGGLCATPWMVAQEAGEPAPPELDFLEYLGAWTGDDEEWIAIEEWQRDNGADDDGNGTDDGAEQAPPRQRNDDEDE